MTTSGIRMGDAMASNLMKTLKRSSKLALNAAEEMLTAAKSSLPVRDKIQTTAQVSIFDFLSYISSFPHTSHTAKWMQDTSKKSPMELINEVPPIKVGGRFVACEGNDNPALGYPIEFICLDLNQPVICKYCGLCYVQDHGHRHH
ncbi:NADH dehydrogenase [ubiquinone] iron-sulfur protein 6, mitochondrial-like [Actinidia eriantha]|uniref:NADH dehydrogenase [ubiquinone] iron-sulfur protein 6, mitochondrial-like n=1 Tax=Actinidia eriantha TaxID=165200 RepID=UPI00258A69A1|nr:NADH dehydrogenase [ubiquinone] iron-sulfur protein 6, mitochondrial-like [Actinidia eriantha]